MLIKRQTYQRVGDAPPYEVATTDYFESITLTDPYRHKFADAITEYVYDDMDSWADRGSGDEESPVGWFAPVGSKRIIRGDERGFVWMEKFGNEYERDLVYHALEGVYYAWGDAAAWSDFTHELELECRENYLAYVYDCDRESQTPHSFETWLLAR